MGIPRIPSQNPGQVGPKGTMLKIACRAEVLKNRVLEAKWICILTRSWEFLKSLAGVGSVDKPMRLESGFACVGCRSLAQHRWFPARVTTLINSSKHARTRLLTCSGGRRALFAWGDSLSDDRLGMVPIGGWMVTLAFGDFLIGWS